MLNRQDSKTVNKEQGTRVRRAFPSKMGNFFVLPNMDTVRDCKPAGKLGVGVGFGAHFLVQDEPYAGEQDPDLPRNDAGELGLLHPVNRYYQTNAVEFKTGDAIEDRNKWPIWQLFYTLGAFPLYSGKHPSAVGEDGERMSWADFLLADFIENVQTPHNVEESWFTQAGSFTPEQEKFWAAVGEWFKGKLRAIHEDPEGVRPGIFQLEIRPDKRDGGKVYAQLEGSPLSYTKAKAQMDAKLPICRREYTQAEKDLTNRFAKQKGSKPGTGGKAPAGGLGGGIPAQQEVDLGDDDD